MGGLESKQKMAVVAGRRRQKAEEEVGKVAVGGQV